MSSVLPLLGIACASVLVVAALVAVYVMWDATDRTSPADVEVDRVGADGTVRATDAVAPTTAFGRVESSSESGSSER